jgi:hypothetical protein
MLQAILLTSSLLIVLAMVASLMGLATLRVRREAPALPAEVPSSTPESTELER